VRNRLRSLEAGPKGRRFASDHQARSSSVLR
jgi:hypothetical protein